MTVNELTHAKQWLYDVLSNDGDLMGAAPGGIFEAVAPDDVAGVFVTFDHFGGADLKTHNDIRIWSDQLWLVRARGQVNDGEALAIAADRIDALLHLGSGDADDARIYVCSREEPFTRTHVENGIIYRELGGMYRLKIQDPVAA